MQLDRYTGRIFKWLRGGEPTATAFWINNWLVTKTGTVSRGILARGASCRYEFRYKDPNLYRGFGYLMDKLGQFDELRFSDVNFVTMSRNFVHEPIKVHVNRSPIIAVSLHEIVSVFEGIEDITTSAIIYTRKDAIEISFDFSSAGPRLRSIPAFVVISSVSRRTAQALLEGIESRNHPVEEIDDVPF